jgi:VCBS repeat-containing protein
VSARALKSRRGLTRPPPISILTSNDTTTSSSKRVVGLGNTSNNINDNPSHLDIGSLGLSAIAGVYGELRVASNNTISYWITDDGALESALANSANVTETFYYRVANEFGSEDDGEITITINRANDRPVANPYTITRTYDSSGFTIGTSSAGHPLVSGGITDADDSGPFVFSGIHADTSSNKTLANAVQTITIDNFGTVTVNGSDELVFTPHSDLANLPQGQSISRSFIYFVTDDGGAYNEGSNGVDLSDKITITINGTAQIETPQFRDQNQQVAKIYFQKNNKSTSSGNSLNNHRFNVLNDTRFAYSSNPSAHGESNLQNGSLINDIWTISGAGNTLEFGGWTFADGTADTGNAYASEMQGVTSNTPHFSENSGSLEVGNSSYFYYDNTLGEGDTGTYTWYYRVNVVNNGNIISSDIGQLDIILEGINDVASTVRTGDPTLYDKTNSGQGDRITTAVTASKNLDISITDPDAGDTTTVQRIRLYARLAGSYPEKNEALDALEGSEFFLNRGESTDDSDWEHSDAWGVLSDHFVITFNSDGTLDYVSKRDAYRSSDGDFMVHVVSWTEHVGGVDSVQTNIDRTGSIEIRNIEYSANNVEFVDDAVAVTAVGSGTGSGSVAPNDNFFTSLESFKRSTGSYNVRVAAGQTIVGEYITLTMNANGSYSYTLNQKAFNALGNGETASESFTYWGHRNPNAGNEVGQATLTFNFTGQADAFVAVNDTARVVAGQTITGVSGDLGNQSSLSVYESSGTLTSNDINDAGNLTVVSFRTGREASGSGTNIPLNATNWIDTPNGEVRWNNNRYEFRADDVSSEVIEYFTYTVRNGDGEDDTAELAITIVPATDNEFVVEDLSHTMTDIGDEAGLTKTVTIANLLTHDANAIRSGNEAGASYAITGYAAGDSGSGFSNVGNTIRGTYGTLTINAAGVPTYVFDRPYSLQNAEKGYDVFTFEVTDGRGSPTTNTAQLTVQINGLNTTPSWSDDAAITITEDTGVTLTKYGDLATQGSNNATGYNTALTGGWANYLVDEFGDVDGHEFSKFDNASVERSSYNTTEGWTQWRQASGFQATTVGSATNQNSILIGSVPLGTNNTDDKITVDNTVPVGNSDVFNVSGELTNNIDIRGTFAVTVIGVQNTPVLTAVNDDVTADEKRYFSFGAYFYNKGSYGPDWGPGAFASVTGDASATADIFANDTNVPASMGNIQRVEVSSDGSNWTQVTRNNYNQPSVSNNSRIGGSDFYWRVNSNSSGGSYVEFAPSGFGALGPSDPKETGSFHYRIVELDGTTTTAVVSTQLTPVDDPPEVHRQGAVLDSSRTITVGASGQPNWNNNDGEGYAKPPSGVSNAYVMGNNGDNGDGVSIREVDMPGEHTGGLLDKSNSTLSADPDDNSVILSVTPRYKSGATASELSGLGNNSATSVTLRGNYGELTVNQDGSYSYNADLKRSLNWSYSNSSEDYDYVDSFNIRLGTAGVNGTGSVTTTLDIFFDGTDGAPTARDDTAHVKEDLNINVSGNAAASTSGGDDDSAVDAPGEHSGNLLANDTDANPNPNLQINAAGAGSSLSTLNLATNTDNPYRQITGTYGTLSIYKDGSYNYVANQDAADNLAAGQTANDVFGYRVIDNNNDTDTASLTITVHGTATETYDRDVETNENTPYSFVHTIENNAITTTDFYADDADYSAYNPPIIITSLPHAGTLKLSGVNVVLTNGTKTISGNDLGDLSYVPPTDAHGDDFTFFTYEIQTDTNSDALSGITITMTIDILPDGNNGPPTAADNTVTIAEDATHSFTAGQFNFADVDSDSLNHIKITSLPATGTLKLNDSNVTQGQSIAAADIANLVYTPVANGNGDPYTTFQFKVNDGTADSASAYTMTVDVTPANDLPTAADNTVTIAEDTTHSFTAGQFNFADIDGDSLSSIKITSLPATGALTLNGSAVSQNQTIAASQIANLVYTPVANGNGDPYTTFQFKVNDGTADSASAYTMTIDVTPANDLPTAADNTVTIAEGGTHSFTAGQFNFADVDGDSLNHIKITSLPATGTLKLNDSNVTQGQSISASQIANLVYTPVANGNGDPYTTFQFKVNDGTADSASAYTMTVDVTPANDLPTAADNTVTIAEDATHSFAAGQFNFADVDGDSLNHIKITSLPATGTLKLNDSNVTQGQSISASQIANLVYTPVANGNGDPYTTFQFKVNDGTADSASAYTMTVDVTPANDLPTAADNTVTIAEDATHSFTAGQFNFADIDGDSLNHIKITSLPATGTLKLNDSNVTQGQSIAAADIANLVYTPVANGNGDPYTTFQFKVNDGTADSASAYTMTVDVTPANDLPTAADNTVTIAEDTTHSFTAGQFNFADIDGDSLSSIKITSLPATGALTLNGSAVSQNQTIAASQIANLVYTPVANGNGDPYTTFQFKVNDGTADSASAYTMTIDVTPANDLPTAADNTVTIAEDATHSFTAGQFNFADIDGDSLSSIKITSLPATGALTLSGSAVSQNQTIAASQIANLVYTPVANGNGDPYTTFQFKGE